MNINSFLQERKNLFTEASDSIWDYSELKFKEDKSAEILRSMLLADGFTIENVENVPNAFVATFGEGEPTIGFLGEFDALDGQSQIHGIAHKQPMEGTTTGHGCGHNLLGVAAMASAMALKDYLIKNNVKATVKYFGCPGEEGGSGKAFMAKEGVFDSLDSAITWHPAAVNGLFSISTLSNIQCLFKFKGRSSHAAASPHLGRSALDSVELMNVGVNYLREHIIQEARVHYAITNTGGISPNVVQAEAEVLYLIRAPKMDDTIAIFERIKDVARGAALMSGTEVEIIFDKACSNVVPNNTLSRVMSNVGVNLSANHYTEDELKFAGEIMKTLSEDDISTNAKTAMVMGKMLTPQELSKPILDEFIPYKPSNFVLPASSDVGDVSWITPTVQCFTCCYAQGTPMHSWQLVAQGKTSLAHKGMITAAEIMAQTAIELIDNPSLITEAKSELSETLRGKSYTSPIPDGSRPRV